jgi:hypothetical protein
MVAVVAVLTAAVVVVVLMATYPGPFFVPD